jgi:O-antigen/teichoic acid export membrane protein
MSNLNIFLKRMVSSKYFDNTAWLFTEKIVKLFNGIFVTIWVANYLGPSEFGLLNYVISLVGIFTVFSTLGLDGIVVRELVKTKNMEVKNYILSTVFWLKIAGSVIAITLIYITSQFIKSDENSINMILILSMAMFFYSFNTVDYYFQSEVLSKYVVYIKISVTFLVAILKIILILSSAPIMAFVYMFLFDASLVGAGLLLIFIVKSPFTNFKIVFDRDIALKLLKDSWPLIISGLFVSIYMKVDQVMIHSMLSDKDVGHYAAAAILSQAWYFIPMVITASFFPLIVEMKERSGDKFLKKMQVILDVTIWISILIAIFVTVYGESLVNYIYGDAYSKTGKILIIHIFAGVSVSFSYVWSKILLSENKQKIILNANILGSIFNVILNYILIGKIGVIGAAYATLFSYILADIYVIYSYKQQALLFMFLKCFDIGRVWRRYV